MTYTFKVLKAFLHSDNVTTIPVGAILEVTMTVSEYDDFVKANAEELERYIDTPPAVSFAGKVFTADIQARQPDTFKEVLSKIGEAHPSSPLADRYQRNRTIKSVKTKETVDKHRKVGRKAQAAIREMKKTRFA